MTSSRAALLATVAFTSAVAIAIAEEEPHAASGVLAAAVANTGNTAVAVTRRDRTLARRRPRSPSYLGELLLRRDSVVMRWPDRRANPIAVWIRDNAALNDEIPALATEVRNALAEWQATGIPVRVAFVPDSARAEVRVTWVDRFDEPVSGRTVWTRDEAHHLTEGTITLARHHAWGAPLDRTATRALALHEIGHLLGLDHAGDDDAIMAPRVRARALTTADVATIRALYALPVGRLR